MLMFKMANTRQCHSHIVGITIVYAVLILHRAAGLHHCRNAGFVRNLYTIGEREKSIRKPSRLL